jgi:hypothetical protein
MKTLFKFMWVLYLVGLVSCGSRSGQRRATSTPKEVKDSVIYFVRVHNKVHPLKITEIEYKAMSSIKMDSVTVEKNIINDYFETSDWEHEDYQGQNFLYVTIPFANIAGQNITPTK